MKHQGRRPPSGSRPTALRRVASDLAGSAGGPAAARKANWRLRVAAALAAAAGIGLAGCTMVGPDYVTPEAPVNGAWLEQAGAGAQNAVPPDRFWWESFQDPALTKLVQSAVAQNLSVRSAGLRVIEARARRGIAVGRFFPQVQDLGGGLSWTHPTENGVFPPPDEGFQEDFAGLSAAWELDFWGRFRRGIESSDAEVLASVADYDAVMVSLIGDVATNYVLVRAFQERLGFTRANVAVQQDTLDLTETRFRAGAVSELDVATAKATLAATNASIPVLEDQLRAAKLALCVLLGRTPSNLDAELATAQGQAARVPDAPAGIAAGIPADLLRRRPDVRFAERVAAAQSARIGVATADLYPAISITGSTGFAASDVNEGGRTTHLGDIAQSDSWQGFIGLGVRWPILNYGRIENNIRVEDALYEQAVTDYRQAVLAAAADVESGLSTFLRSREQSAFLAEAVAATQRTVEISLIQYRTGAVDFIRVNDAQTDLVVQQDAQVQARAATALGAIRTFRALGGGWEVRGAGEFVDKDTVRRMTERADWGDVMDPDWQNWTDWERFPRPETPPAGTAPAPAPAPRK